MKRFEGMGGSDGIGIGHARILATRLIVVDRWIEPDAEIPRALDRGAESIGLLRTEFLDLHRGDLPSEEEQCRDAIAALESVPSAASGRFAPDQVVDAATRAGKPISVGGDMAGDPMYTWIIVATMQRRFPLELAQGQ